MHKPKPPISSSAPSQLSVASNLANLDHFDEEIRKLELHLERSAKIDDSQAFFLLKTIPGVGKVLALTML